MVHRVPTSRNNNILLPARFVTHGYRSAGRRQVCLPHDFTGLQVKGPEAVVQGVADKYQAACSEQRATRARRTE